jgi:chemotaxis protein methyltransferase CheR
MSAGMHRDPDDTAQMQAFLRGVYASTGFDFRDYSVASMRRRIAHFAQTEGLEDVGELCHRARTERDFAARFVLAVTVHSTAMFRDPWFYVALREKVLPLLRSYPFVRIWHAGCSTGEEVYSLAILLHEENLAARCRIYATDLSEVVLQRAKAGIFSLQTMREYTQNYLKAGGRQEFSHYYSAHHGRASFRPELVENVVFAQHNLVTDRSFNSFQLVLCRNVMIYFNRDLQRHVHELLYQSLDLLGVLGVGDKESLQFSPREGYYEVLDEHAKLYRRVR